MSNEERRQAKDIELQRKGEKRAEKDEPRQSVYSREAVVASIQANIYLFGLADPESGVVAPADQRKAIEGFVRHCERLAELGRKLLAQLPPKE